MSEVLLRARRVSVEFPVRRGGLQRPRTGAVRALDGVDLEVHEGEALAIVGESGCGKTTLARCLVGLQSVSGGSVEYRGADITNVRGQRLSAFRREVTMVFQHPVAALDPRMRVGRSVQEPLDIHAVGTVAERRSRVHEAFERVGLSAEHVNRYPHEFSGGQCQRIGIARALVMEPRVMVCDEPVSALDTSVQAQILNLLDGLRRDLGLAYVLIAHDLDVVRQVADRVQVMYLGRTVEAGSCEAVYQRPLHPYTAALLAARPVPYPVAARSRGAAVLPVDAPSPIHPPGGCRFHPRCPRAHADCVVTDPPLAPHGHGHRAACLHPLGP